MAVAFRLPLKRLAQLWRNTGREVRKLALAVNGLRPDLGLLPPRAITDPFDCAMTMYAYAMKLCGMWLVKEI